jgi:molybdopterin-binding protein
MKKILFALLLLPVFAAAQRLQYVNTYGYQYQRVVVDSLFAPPSDTFSVPTALQGYPFIARKGTGLYLWNTSTHVWAAVSGGGGSRFAYPSEDNSAGENRSFNLHNTRDFTFDSVNNFYIKRSNQNRLEITNGVSKLYNADGSAYYGAGAGVLTMAQGGNGSIFSMRGDTSLFVNRISYNSNIHSTFTPYSLVTKKYTDSVGGSSMVYPGAGIPNSTGSAWGTSYSTTGSGTVVALATQPTFTTDITTPMIVGGSATGQKLTFKTTTGVGSGDSILFKGGNNGATTFASIQAAGLNLLDNSYLKIGGSNILHFNTGSNNATFAGAYNFLFNNGGNVFMNSANTTYFSTSTGDLYFSGSGKLGIGTATPGGPLHVKANAGAIDALFVDGTTGNVGIGTATPTAALDVVGDLTVNAISNITLNAVDNINLTTGHTAISMVESSRTTDYQASNGHTFSTGTVTITNLAGTGTRAVLADASGVVSAPVSDRSTKQNITDLNTGISTIMKLRPVSFEYRDEYKKQFGKGTQIGFIAQDIQEVLPNSVYYNTAGVTKGKMGYNEIDLVPLLVSAMQEQQKQIEQLKKEIKKLKSK